MCNCGKKRINTYDPYQYISNRIDDSELQTRREDIRFEYTGKTGLTVTGSATGRKYRFDFPGDIQPIDYKDSSGMMAISLLKKVRKEN